MIKTSIYGQEPEENLNPFENKKKRGISSESVWWGRCPVIESTQYGVWMGVGKGGWGFFILGCTFSGSSFSVCVTCCLAFENQNDRCYYSETLLLIKK